MPSLRTNYQISMKKFILLFVMSLGFTVLMAQNQMEQRACNKAEAAAQECLQTLGLNNITLHSAATVNQICDYMNPNPQYFGYSVDVWATPNCAPGAICAQVIYPIARVFVSCGGQVTEVQCATSGF